MVVLRFCFVFVAVTCIMAQTGTKRKRESVLDYFRVSTFVSDTEGAGTNATNKENCDQNGGPLAAAATCDIFSVAH